MTMSAASSSMRASQQMQQYLASLPQSSAAPTLQVSDTASLVKQSVLLTGKVDALHAKCTTVAPHAIDKERRYQQSSEIVVLLNDLRRLISRIHSAPTKSRTRELDTCRDTTLQNIDILQTLLGLMSSSSSAHAAVSSVFSAPVSDAISTRDEASQQTPPWNYTSLKETALQTLDSDTDSYESDDDSGDDAALGRQTDSYDEQLSEPESVLTDPHDDTANITAPLTQKPLGALKKQSEQPRAPLQDSDFDEYGPPKTVPAAPVSGDSGTAADTILQGDRSTQEALSGELLRMASILKSNSLAFAEALERDRVLLEKAGNDLGQNLDLMTKTRGRLGVYSKKVRSMGWFTLGAIAVVMFSWMFMFIVIRLT